MTLNQSKPFISLKQQNSETKTRKSWTDIDIEYKDFEHFQQSTRFFFFYLKKKYFFHKKTFNAATYFNFNF